jgi:hypothetical protein
MVCDFLLDSVVSTWPATAPAETSRESDISIAVYFIFLSFLFRDEWFEASRRHALGRRKARPSTLADQLFEPAADLSDAISITKR